MRTLVAVSPNTVFAKTSKGREEISQRQHGLTPSQRRVLIVIDGSKNFEEIIALIPAIIPHDQLEQIFSLLLQQGFIASMEDSADKPKLIVLEKPAPAAVLQAVEPTFQQQAVEPTSHHVAPVLSLMHSAASREDASLTKDPETIRQVKDFMATTAHTYLGLLSAEVIQRIERAKDAAQLMSVVGHWHMALRGSRQGNRFAGPYLEQVKRTLNGEASLAEPAQLMAQ
jgi:hypothetical protein